MVCNAFNLSVAAPVLLPNGMFRRALSTQPESAEGTWEGHSALDKTALPHLIIGILVLEPLHWALCRRNVCLRLAGTSEGSRRYGLARKSRPNLTQIVLKLAPKGASSHFLRWTIVNFRPGSMDNGSISVVNE